MIIIMQVLVEGPDCHPFCEDGPHGFMRCEGWGSVVLRRLTDAQQSGDRILAKVSVYLVLVVVVVVNKGRTHAFILLRSASTVNHMRPLP